MIDPHIFRAYDIRGKADIQLTEDACFQIGRAFGTVLQEKYGKEHAHPTVVLGRDARTHSPKFMESMCKGLMQSGCAVSIIGETPSPVNYFTICNANFDAGVQITASHNPKEDNGIKLQLRDAEAYSGDDLQDLKKRIENKVFVDAEGSKKDFDAVTPYVQFLSRLFKDAGKGKTVVVDGGNGVAGPVYCDVLRRTGAHVIELYTEPDGTFPNHAADPSKHSTLVIDSTLMPERTYNATQDGIELVKGKLRLLDWLRTMRMNVNDYQGANLPLGPEDLSVKILEKKSNGSTVETGMGIRFILRTDYNDGSEDLYMELPGLEVCGDVLGSI
jgi:phosphomannomutase/phosphoglucomutase